MRKAKNCYTWKGFDQIPAKLVDLREKADADLYGTPADFRTPLPSRRPLKKHQIHQKLATLDDSAPSTATAPSSVETEPDVEVKPVRTGSRKEKSLGVLSQRFVQLFLLAGSRPVSLDQAAIQLLGRSPSDVDPLAVSPAEGDSSKLLKTKVRRLYDIANILSSLRLIEKVHTSNRKPSFKWLGPSEGAVDKRALEDAERLPTAKRRRVIAAEGGGNGGGFDAKTLARVDAVLQGFPDTYARQWRDYVNAIQAMLIDGQVTREQANNSVSALWPKGDEKRVSSKQGSTLSGKHNVAPKQAVAISKQDGAGSEQKEAVLKLTEGIFSQDNVTSKLDETVPKHDSGSPKKCDGATGEVASEHDNGTSVQGDLVLGQQQASEQNSADLKQMSVASARNGTAAVNNCDDREVDKDAPPSQMAVAQQLSGPAPNACPGNSSGRSKEGISEDVAIESEGKESANSQEFNGKKVVTGGFALSAAANVMNAKSCKKGTEAKLSAVPSTWTPENIRSYIERANAAGPEYAKAAERWLLQLQQWQRNFAMPLAALTSMPLSSSQAGAVDKGTAATKQ